MARLNEEWRALLTSADLARYPVWTWDDGKDGHLPIDDLQVDPDEYETLFIKARFFAGDREFDGYVVDSGSVYAFALFVGGREIMFNLNMTPEDARSKSSQAYWAAGGQPFKLFPLQYESDVVLRGARMRGEIDWPKDGPREGHY